MSPRLRKFALTAHVISSVGRLGAVAAFLALSLAGLIGENTQAVRSAYLAMESVTWFVIVPLCLASLVSGLVMSLGTTWGLFRHYWVVIKLVLTLIGATIVLLVHTRPIGYMADVAAEGPLSRGDFHGLRIQLVADAAAALVALLIATTLAVYKPRGMTRYGWRKQNQERTGLAP